MNAQAEKEIDRLMRDLSENRGYVSRSLRDAMSWAYADAARECRSHDGRAIHLGREANLYDLLATAIENLSK